MIEVESFDVTGKLVERSSGRVIPNASFRFVPERADPLVRLPEAVAYLAAVDAVTDADGVVSAPNGDPVRLARTDGWTWRATIKHNRFARDITFRFYVTGPVVLHTVPLVVDAPPANGGGGLSLVDAGGGLYAIGGMTDQGGGLYSP